MQGLGRYILEPRNLMHDIFITNGPLLMFSIPVSLRFGHFTALIPGSHLEPMHFEQVSITFRTTSLLTPLDGLEKVK